MTPLILAVDTTHEHGSLALAHGDEILVEQALDAPSGFAHVLFDALEQLLRSHSVRLGQIGLFASASGPGSFTGVRVGLAFTKGIAEALGKPAAAVSNLRALASFGSARLRAAMIDARRGEIYGAVFDEDGRTVVDEAAMPAAKWLESLPSYPGLEFICADEAFARAATAGTRFENAPLTIAPPSLAGAVARLAAEAFARGGVFDPAAIDANYVRRPDIR